MVLPNDGKVPSRKEVSANVLDPFVNGTRVHLCLLLDHYVQELQLVDILAACTAAFLGLQCSLVIFKAHLPRLHCSGFAYPNVMADRGGAQTLLALHVAG
jgi:hypothetical protein